jgi:Peptidase family M48
MRTRRILPALFALIAIPMAVAQQPPAGVTHADIVDKIVAQERAEMQLLRQYSPLVETYIQNLRSDGQGGADPDGDKYFLGRAELAKGVELESLVRGASTRHKKLSGLENFLSMEFVPRGFLQMIYIDMNGFDPQHYKFTYARREFLGDVRCMVFDVDPLAKNEKGRFVGRIWVEEQEYHIVRFNGRYSGSSFASYYFNFDSWRQNTPKNEWLPSFIYSEEGSLKDLPSRKQLYKAFRAQTRLWGYALGRAEFEEQELNKILVETPVRDQAENANDYSPIEAQRLWSRQAEDNVTSSLERLGLMAPAGEVDKVLETVINNLEVTNDLDIQPEVRCRVLMTSTLESFTIGHTIVLSRGLVDVLPDEASLAAVLAHELGHVVLAHRMDTTFAFFNRSRFEEKDTFRHFDFARTSEEEVAANQKGIELLSKSPYKDQSATAQAFLQALQNRAKEIPNLISPHLGDRVPVGWALASSARPADSIGGKPVANAAVALPLGGRIKVEPWSDHLQLIKSKPAGTIAEQERMPFEIAPFMLYLTRQGIGVAPEAASAKTDTEAKP